MQAECHIWMTADGELVAAGDPKATVLAYAPGDEVSPADEDTVRALSEPDEKRPAEEPQASQAKQAPKPADKAAKREGDK